MVDLVAVCIFYTHIRFMKGMCSDHSVKLDVHTRCQVLRLKDSHETTSLTRPNSNPGLPGSASSQLVLLCFSRDLIRSFTEIIRSLREVTLSREFEYHPSFPCYRIPYHFGAARILAFRSSSYLQRSGNGRKTTKRFHM